MKATSSSSSIADLAVDASDKRETSTFVYSRLTLIVVGLIGNVTVVALMCRHSRLNSQHNKLLLNLAYADMLLIIVSAHFALTHLFIDENDIERDHCIALQLPIIWALFLTLCSVVPLAHYRVKLIKAYSQTTTNFVPDWQFRAGIITLWTTTLLFVMPALQCVNEHESYSKCMLPLLVTVDYLLPFFIFMTTVAVIVCGEYAKIMYSVFSSSRKETYDNDWQKYVHFDRHVTRVVIMMLSTFFVCWWPFLLSILYFLYAPIGNREIDSTVHMYADFVSLFPLVNSALNPFLHTLSEQEFWQTLKRDLHGGLISYLYSCVYNRHCRCCSVCCRSRRSPSAERAQSKINGNLNVAFVPDNAMREASRGGQLSHSSTQSSSQVPPDPAPASSLKGEVREPPPVDNDRSLFIVSRDGYLIEEEGILPGSVVNPAYSNDGFVTASDDETFELHKSAVYCDVRGNSVRITHL